MKRNSPDQLKKRGDNIAATCTNAIPKIIATFGELYLAVKICVCKMLYRFDAKEWIKAC